VARVESLDGLVGEFDAEEESSEEDALVEDDFSEEDDASSEDSWTAVRFPPVSVAAAETESAGSAGLSPGLYIRT